MSGSKPPGRFVPLPPNEVRVDGQDIGQAETEGESAEEKSSHRIFSRPPQYVGGFGSDHAGPGAVFAFADGQVVFISEHIDPIIYQNLGHRDDGSLIDMRDVK